MYKHQLTPFIGPQKQSTAQQSFFAAHCSYGYVLVQKNSAASPELLFRQRRKELADV